MHILTGDGHVDKETLLVLLLASLMGAVGILAFVAKCLKVDLATLAVVPVLGIVAGLTGGIFGAFLLVGFWQRKR